MRFSARRNVDFPHPEGPISAVIWFELDGEIQVYQSLEIPVIKAEVVDFDLVLHEGRLVDW
jgi:hypothetical protein